MNNILIAKETMKIIKEGQYDVAGEIIKLPKLDYESVDVISPQLGEKLLAENREHKKAVLIIYVSQFMEVKTVKILQLLGNISKMIIRSRVIYGRILR